LDIVLIPAYYRPEFLALCLEHLSKTEGSRDDKQYWIMQDYRYDDDMRYGMQARWTKEVVEKSPLPVRFLQRKPHGFAGNSHNVLEAYKEAYQTSARLVYLVEEDVLVTPDFFHWHEFVQVVEPKTMCSIAYRCSRNNEAYRDITDPTSYFTTARDYASIGVCWKRENLGPVLQHACPEYYADQEGYIRRTFPGNRFAGDFCEQDGLVMRVMWEQRAFTTWPYVPRAYHLGGYGYHRPAGKRPDGQLQTKINTLREWVRNADILKTVAPDFGDIEPYDDTLNQRLITSLTREQHFK